MRTLGPLRFVEPVGLAMLSAWAEHQRAVRRRVVRLDLEHQSPYAWSVGLGPVLRGTALPREVPGRAYARFGTSADTARGTERFVDALGIRQESSRDLLVHCMHDLCQNVFDHAAPHTGAHIVAHHDAKTQWVRLGVADCGEGIAADIRQAYTHGDDLTDVQAVSMALEPLVSGSIALDGNRGVGLTVVRRLALAAEGAIWLRTGTVVVRSRSTDATLHEPQVSSAPDGSWTGTAVAVAFKASLVTDFHQQIGAILAELEGRGPAYAEVSFVRAAIADRHDCVPVEPDASSFALDRARASALRRGAIEPALRQGRSVCVDFSAVRRASQGFCHALLAEIAREHGREVLSRLVFAACSDQVKLVVRSALQAGLQRRDSDADQLEDGQR